MKLLIHHHVVGFEDESGLYIQSFIGHWVNALAQHFDEIGLLIHVSEKKTLKQDTLLNNPKIKLYSLGLEGRTWDRIERIKRIKKKCRAVGENFDILLIRGITPRQKTIWKYCNTKKKVFFLVGSLKDSKPAFPQSMGELYPYLMYYVRMREFATIARKSTVLSNSPAVVNEIEVKLSIRANFVSTSSISINDFIPFQVKPVSNNIKLLFCGRVTFDKGIEELLLSLKQLNEKTTHHVTLDIVGGVSQEYGKILKKKIADLNLNNHVFWYGFIPFGENLFQFYNKCDYYVLPSHHEGFPHSIWEAAACCTPVLTTKVGGIPGIVNENQVTFIPTKNPDGITSEIIKLIENTESKILKVQNLYALAKAYTIENSALQLSKFLQGN